MKKKFFFQSQESKLSNKLIGHLNTGNSKELSYSCSVIKLNSHTTFFCCSFEADCCKRLLPPETNLEFHGADPVQDFSHVLPDHGPGDLVVALSCGLHCVPGHVIESYHVGQNAHRFVERTEPEETVSK